MEEEVEDFLATFFEGFGAVEDGAAVDVHVFFHALEHGCVGGEFEGGGGFAAEDAAAARGEGDEVGAAGDLAGGGDGVVAWGVHEDEAFAGGGFGVGDDFDQVGAAGFGHGAEGFFEDGGEAAGFVAGGGVGVHLGAVSCGVVFPPAHEGYEFFAGFAVWGAAGEEVFGAVGFRGFGEDDAAAVADEDVAGDAEGGVGGDAGVSVGAAALQGDGEFADGGGFAADVVGFGEDFADEGDGGFYGFAGAAHFLDVHAAEAAGEFLFLEEAGELVHFAAEAEDDDGGEVGVSCVATKRAAQDGQGFAGGHAAAGLVGEGDDAVDIGVVGERIAAGDGVFAEGHGDQVGDVGGAVHAGEDADVVAGGDAAVRAVDAHEGGRRVGEVGGAGVDAVGVVAGEVAHAGVVGVDVFAGGDVGGGEADYLTVATDGLALGDGFDGDFVAGGDALFGIDPFWWTP